MKLFHIFVLSALALTTSCSHAKQEPKDDVPATVDAKDAVTSEGVALSPNAAKALAHLEATQMFADPYVGIAGSPSPQVVAFVTVLNDPGAARAFRQLYAKAAHPAGKLYGLCGLWYVDEAAFKRGVDELRASDTMVQTMSGCIVGPKAIGGLIRANTKFPPHVVLNGSKDSIDAWLKRQPTPPESYVFDIEGGGYPAMMGEQRNNPKFRYVDNKNLN